MGLLTPLIVIWHLGCPSNSVGNSVTAWLRWAQMLEIAKGHMLGYILHTHTHKKKVKIMKEYYMHTQACNSWVLSPNQNQRVLRSCPWYFNWFCLFFTLITQIRNMFFTLTFSSYSLLSKTNRHTTMIIFSKLFCAVSDLNRESWLSSLSSLSCNFLSQPWRLVGDSAQPTVIRKKSVFFPHRRISGWWRLACSRQVKAVHL